MYQLRSTLTGHELDVRGVTAISENVIVSGSRDGTARLWDIQYNMDISSNNEICFLSPTGAFINAVESLPIDPANPLVAIGGKDAVIYISDIHDSFVKQGDDFGKYQLIGHQGNVCSLNYKDGSLISSSWDCTAKVWDLTNFGVKYDLVGHTASVWDAQIVDATEGIYLTCSADRTIRKWRGDVEIAKYTGHNDVIRKLLVLPCGTKFVSASNDCTLKVWDLASGNVLQTLVGHDSFIYDIGILSNGDLVSTAEDRSVRIWHNGTVAQAITLPCISVWSVAVLPNDDIAVGGSDKLIYVFTTDKERAATAEGVAQFKALVEKSTISEQSLDNLKKTDIPGYDRLQKPGKEEGSTIMVKNPAGVIEAHQWTGGEWVKIGDVVDSAGGSSGKKDYNGVEYDYVFDVDVEDGKPPLKLPYNAGENPYTAAERFLANNDLPGSYADEVVRFINQNTAGFQLDEQLGATPGAASEAPKVNTPASSAPVASASSLFPQSTLITFKDYKSEQLIKGFIKFNSQMNEEKKFSTLEEKSVETALNDLKSKQALFLINSIIPKILKEWGKSQKLIAFDMLRISIPRVSTIDLLQSTEAAENIVEMLLLSLEELEENDVPLFMMISKVLCGLTASTLFAQLFLTIGDDNSVGLSTYFDTLVERSSIVIKIFTTSPASQSHKLYKSALSAFASFIFDLSAYPLSNKSLNFNAGSLQPVSSFLDDVAEDIINEDEESTYRLCVAFGNLKVLGATNSNPQWLSTSEKVYTEARFQEVYKAL
ncbi:CIC11C00000003371 [Sungouiella intermedia]|uniref:CIC11C00000003371 n=1 Tax=Sungouiella intermedia TaxID=45354 RepID=A0A1L0C2X4_9ASCO|nr:CIC11C00000003371 [[Candida] intermedia]